MIVYKDYDDGETPGLKIAAPVEAWQDLGVSEGNCGDGQWFCDRIVDGVDSEVAIEMDVDGKPVVFFHDSGSQRLRVASLSLADAPADGEESTAPVNHSDDRLEKRRN